jgi:hypothetical protein
MLTLCTYGTFVRAASLPSEAETGDILQPDPAIQTTLITRQLRIGQLDTEKKKRQDYRGRLFACHDFLTTPRTNYRIGRLLSI